MASSSEARAARRARRSLCSARAWSGVSDEVAANLHSDDETFFGSDVELDSDTESEPSSPPAKRPRLSDHWSDSGSDAEQSSSGAAEQTDAAGSQGSADETLVADETDEQISQRLSAGCSCADANHFSALMTDEVNAVFQQIRAAPAKDTDCFLIGVLTAGMFADDAPHGSDGLRRRVKFRYSVFGREVCREAFSYVFRIGSSRLKRLQKLAAQKRCFPAPHGGFGGVPWNVCTEEMRCRVAEFIRNYASINGLPMPAAPRGRANNAPTYLPASETYVSVYMEYCDAQQEGEESVSLSTFKRIWHVRQPDVIFMKPRQDVCAKCERFRNNLRTSLSEQDKKDITEAWLKHINSAKSEREHYNDCIRQSKEEPDSMTHITFDFAENFVLPYHSRQPGPVYFKVLFRVNDFGIINEAIPEQVHYLFNEGQTIGVNNGKNHGPNCVISMLDHHLSTHDHARVLHAHCDNCCGQNKNKSVMAYCCWRVMAGLEDEIRISFMIVGHTRCSVDGGFGLAKKKYRSADVDSPEQLASTVEASSKQNKVDSFTWEWRDWDEFLALKFRRIVGITKFQHFRFSQEFLGEVRMKQTFESEEVSLKLCKTSATSFDPLSLPLVLPAAGLTDDRRKYLADNVLEFCRPEHRQALQDALN